MTAAATNQAASAPQSSDKESETQALRDEIAQLRRELMSALAQVASNTGKTARILDDVTADSGGQAISVGQAA
ncbi:hypothetical protein [Sphingobium olei]|uniref:Uncharacterized protein n=1 Tax=Sphingobium olei TaxID=420955 RepID=A0ABW3P0N3_9SPHN